MSLLSLDQIKTLYNDLRGRIEANEEGTFPDMSVGSLISDEKISNNAPYLYRPVISGVGNRAWQKLVGATIANNQLVGALSAASITVNGIAVTVTTSNFTLTGGTSGGSAAQRDIQNVNVVANHKYFVGGGFVQLYTSGGSFVANINTTDTSTWGETLYMPSTDGYFRFSAYIKANTVYQTATYTPQLTDLTQDFGSAIADYAYTLETQTAGSGIAWLKSYGFFNLPYYAYDAGSLISTKAEGKRVTGRNHIDEDTIYASFKTGTNAFSGTASAINLAQFNIPQELVGRELTFSAHISSYGATSVRVYATENGTGKNGNTGVAPFWSSVTFTPTSTSDKVQITYGSNGSGITVFDSVQLEIGSSRTAYVPYTSQEYDLGSDELRGLFKLDANNNIVADGDIKTPDGQITRKYGIVDLGTLEWSQEANNIFYAAPTGAKGYYSIYGNTQICSKYGNAQTSSWDEDKVCRFGNSSTNINIRDTSYSDTATFKTAMNGVYLVYELATPTTEQGTPFVDPSIVYPNGTEEYIDTRTVPVPVGNETEYSEDLKGGLETILDTPPANGTYVLKATVSGGVATLGWVAE